MKNLILAALLGAAVTSGGFLTGNYLNKRAAAQALNTIKPELKEANELFPICLLADDNVQLFIITEANEENNTYSGEMRFVMLNATFTFPASTINKRGDLRKVDCATGL